MLLSIFESDGKESCTQSPHRIFEETTKEVRHLGGQDDSKRQGAKNDEAMKKEPLLSDQ